MKTIRRHWITAIGICVGGLVVVAAALTALSQTAPVLTIAPTGTNQYSITITNGVSGGNYELGWPDITDYYQVGNRLLDPVSGQWLSSDSVWNERDPNCYTFAGGDPINYFDSDGRISHFDYDLTPSQQNSFLFSQNEEPQQIQFSTPSDSSQYGQPPPILSPEDIARAYNLAYYMNQQPALGAQLMNEWSGLPNNAPAWSDKDTEQSLLGALTVVSMFVPVLDLGGSEALALGSIGESSELSLDTTFTFRGDSISPDMAFNNGISAKGTSTDLYLHALDSWNPPSAFVPTSTSFDRAAFYNADSIYVIRPVGGIDVNSVLGPTSPKPQDLEIAIPWQVSPNDIRAVTYPQQGQSILNPNWKP